MAVVELATERRRLTDDGIGSRDQQWEVGAVVETVVGGIHLDTLAWGSDSEIVGASCGSYRISQ
jgi:hypothetical protein